MKKFPLAVYPSTYKCVLLLLYSFLFFSLWLFAFAHPGFFHKWLEWGCLTFFVCGALTGCGYMALRFLHKPLVWIYPDRVESFMPIKNRYETIAFSEVDKFTVMRTRHLVYILARCRGHREKVLNANSALVSHIDAVCDALNHALALYRKVSASTKDTAEL